MELMNEDVIALVLSTHDDWENCCITEYTKDGTWHCGMNYITSIKEALTIAHENKINIIFEEMLEGKSKKSE